MLYNTYIYCHVIIIIVETQVSPAHYHLLLLRGVRKITCSFEEQRYKENYYRGFEKKEKEKNIPSINRNYSFFPCYTSKPKSRKKEKKKKIRQNERWEEREEISNGYKSREKLITRGRLNALIQAVKNGGQSKRFHEVQSRWTIRRRVPFAQVTREFPQRIPPFSSSWNVATRWQQWGLPSTPAFSETFAPLLNFPANIKIYERARLKRLARQSCRARGKCSSFKMDRTRSNLILRISLLEGEFLLQYFAKYIRFCFRNCDTRLKWNDLIKIRNI